MPADLLPDNIAQTSGRLAVFRLDVEKPRHHIIFSREERRRLSEPSCSKNRKLTVETSDRSLHGGALAAVELQSLVESVGLVGPQLDSDVVNPARVGPPQLGQLRQLRVVTAASL